MSLTFEDRLKISLKKAEGECRKVLGRTSEVILAGDSVKDRYNGLSRTQQKRYFKLPEQVEAIQNDVPLHNMDTSLLRSIISAFGKLTIARCGNNPQCPQGTICPHGCGNNPKCPHGTICPHVCGNNPQCSQGTICPHGKLLVYVNELRQFRNELAHEDHKIQLTKKKFKKKIKHLKEVCSSILELLKRFPDPAASPYFPTDQEISEVRLRFEELEKTLEDQLEHRVGLLLKTCSKAGSSSSALTQCVEDNTIKLKQGVEDSTLKLAKGVEDSTIKLTQGVEDSTLKLEKVVGNVAKKSSKIGKNFRKLEKDLEASNLKMKDLENSTLKITQHIEEFQQLAENLKDGKSAMIGNVTREELKHHIDEKLSDYHNEIGFVPQETFLPNRKKYKVSSCKSSLLDVSKITTEFMLVTDESLEEVYFKNALDRPEQVIVVSGEGSSGKTVYTRFIGKNPHTIKGLEKHPFVLHMECKNRELKTMQNVFENLFDSMWIDYGIDYPTFEHFVLSSNPIFLIDGYDQEKVNDDRDALVQSILEKKIRCVITTRPHRLKDIIYLCKNKNKTCAVLNLKGIHHKNFLKFAENYLVYLVSEEKDRQIILRQLKEDFVHFYRYLGKAMHSPLTLQNIIYWKVYNYLRKSTKSPLNSIGKILSSLFSIKIEVAQERLANNHMTSEEIEQVMKKFLPMAYKLCCKTFIKYEFDLNDENENEVKKICSEILKSNVSLTTHLLSIFYTATLYKIKNRFKFIHQIEQEYGYAIFLCEQMLKHINGQETEHELLSECIIWAYLFSEEESTDALEKNKHEIKRFANIILFFTSEIARIKKEYKLKDIFKRIAVKLVNLAWYAGDSMIPAEVESYEDISSSIESLHQIDTNDFENSQIPMIENANETDSDSESDIISDSDSDSDIHELGQNEENYTHLSSCQEDIALMTGVEADFDDNVNRALAGKLSSKPEWIITNPVSLTALCIILKKYIDPEYMPSKIQFSIDVDPLLFPEFDVALSILKKKKIKVSLQFNGQYKQFYENKYSDKYINSEILLESFTGKLSEIGIRQLPSSLMTMHLSLGIQDVGILNEKLQELQNLQSLDLKIEIREDYDIESIPCLSFCRDLSICIVVGNMDVKETAKVIAKLKPVESSKLIDLSCQKCSYSYTDICNFVGELKNENVTLLGFLKIWSSHNLDKKEVSDIAKMTEAYQIGGFLYYRNLDMDAALPKQMRKQDEWSQETTLPEELVHKTISNEDAGTIPGSRYSYDIKKGRVLFFNFVQFNDSRKNRKGAEEDNDVIRDTFECYGTKYDIRILENLTSEQMLEYFRELQKDESLSEIDALIIFISSHGKSKHVFYTRDGEMDLNDIRPFLYESPEGCPYLRGNPKIFFCNYFQGKAVEDTRDLDVEESANYALISERGKKERERKVVPLNIKTFFSTSDGVVAWRRPNGGNYFLQIFCRVLKSDPWLELQQLIYKTNEEFEKELKFRSTFSEEGSRFNHFYF